MAASAWERMLQAVPLGGYGTRYRRYVRDSLRYVDAQDRATGGDHIPEFGDVYVDLGLVSYDGLGGTTDRSVAEVKAADDGERRSIDALLDRRDPAVLALVGLPGSGKTTLLAHAARRSARSSVTRGSAGRRHAPVRLALREHAASVVANPALSLPDVVRAAVGGAAGREPVGWWEKQLRGGRCVVLLDGLDEVARPDDRLAVAGWVETQVAAYPGNHFVVTARTHGLPKALAGQADVYIVLPFTAGQVKVFLDRWYQAAEQHATGAAGRAARRAAALRAQESAARLLAVIREQPALYDLAVNPLLLTMIATAHRYRGALPGSRADLYGEICQVLLSRRSQAKDLPELLPWPAKQGLLAALAYQLMSSRASEFSTGEALEVLGPQLARYPAAATGEAFLDDAARNGLLAETTPGRYAFTHLTFQEYLAARHVTATPDLVKALADNVSDPWWHEAILLYVATADASPIVRACLEAGTIPALTLAFDCDEAGAEIDPELRQHLEAERLRAYEVDCPREHRQLIAGVQAARLIRHTFVTASGTRICARPVPAELYWLFLADTQAARPDSPCVPGADQPAAGVWGTEARAFVKWLNSVTAIATGIEVRFPRHDELAADDIGGLLDSQLPPVVTSAWTRPLAATVSPSAPPELWVRAGRPHPQDVDGTAVRQAVAADARASGLLPQVITAAVLDAALEIARSLADVHALSGALADDLAARAASGGQVIELMHAHAHALVHTYSHTLRLIGGAAIGQTCAADPGLVAALGLAPTRALADAIAGDLAIAIGDARATALDLATVIDQDLNVLSMFEFDLTQANELHAAHAAALDRAYARARDILDDPNPALAAVFGREALPALDPAFPIPALLGLPLRWAADGPLAPAALEVLAARRGGDAHQAFTDLIASRAGVHDNTTLRAALGSPLTDALRGLATTSAGGNGRSDGADDWILTTGLARLTQACAPVDADHRAPAPEETAGLRAIALALAGTGAASGTKARAGTAPGTDVPGVLRMVTATVTLAESRAKGASPAGETIILALA